MKHVREELPDVQLRRPEVSSALAAVVDRATDKDLSRRYADDGQFIADLEEVLAIETARAGQATGEQTAVLRTLPPGAQRRVPARLLHRTRLIVGVLLTVVAAVVVLVLLADRTERGTGTGRVKAPEGLKGVSLGQSGAQDFDPPPGDGQEHHADVRAVLDRDPNSTWSTETYQGGNLAPKEGVGIFIDAKPDVAATQMEVRSRTKGWDATIYAARNGTGPPPAVTDPQWKQVGEIRDAGTRERVSLDTAGNRFRYYLIWITKIPESSEHVEISEVFLYRVKR
jgi:serine/threonine-protein kinase